MCMHLNFCAWPFTLDLIVALISDVHITEPVLRTMIYFCFQLDSIVLRTCDVYCFIFNPSHSMHAFLSMAVVDRFSVANHKAQS